jgi:hypothetical protein
MDDDRDFTDMDGASAKEPPPTKTVKESVVAVAIALGAFAAVAALIWNHLMPSLIGEIARLVATVGSGYYAANYVYKGMVGFHSWTRRTVVIIVFITVYAFIRVALGTHHFY